MIGVRYVYAALRASRTPSLVTPTRTDRSSSVSAASGVSQIASALDTVTPGTVPPSPSKSPKKHVTALTWESNEFAPAPKYAPVNTTKQPPVSGPEFGNTDFTSGGAVNRTRKSLALDWKVDASYTSTATKCALPLLIGGVGQVTASPKPRSSLLSVNCACVNKSPNLQKYVPVTFSFAGGTLKSTPSMVNRPPFGRTLPFSGTEI
mmetsp:Transcript_10306/g.34078  ORF Transcript_10306/g.34078 Transcript_10306/m.34078 type:complete len:206 (-) Transcript_10306:1749-2366(-)